MKICSTVDNVANATAYANAGPPISSFKAAPIALMSADRLMMFATSSRATNAMARPNEYCERMLAPSPLPVTRPMRAQII